MPGSGQSVTRNSEAEVVQLRTAANHLRKAEESLGWASTCLGKTDRLGWWYEVNKLYRGSIRLAEILEGEHR